MKVMPKAKAFYAWKVDVARADTDEAERVMRNIAFRITQSGRLHFITAKGDVDVRDGDWLVRDEGGNLHAYAANDFERLFDMADAEAEGQGGKSLADDDIPTAEAINDVLTSMFDRMHEEYKTMTREDLERFWHYNPEDHKLKAYRYYAFFNALNIYGNSCKKWETMHNGHMFVVARVRDLYLMPKIREFIASEDAISGEQANT